MRILLLSGYNTPSHEYWGNKLITSMPQFNWTILTLPPRKFSWRIRGNPLSWYATENEILNKSYDTILATSMVDLATIIGLFPHLGKCHKVYYFHENQFEYPLSQDKNNSNVESMMVNLYGALACDQVLFNSNYNRESFFKGARKFLKRINDYSPVQVMDIIERKSSVIPVPIVKKDLNKSEKIKNSIIWNHRWEYDKNPEDFYLALKELKKRGVDFKLIIMGIQFKNSPEAFSKIEKEFKDSILCFGHQTRKEYINWLKKGEFIISTAIHEFQGLAVMEGVQYGAIPLVPERLSYPQWFLPENLFEKTYKDLADLLERSFNKPPAIPNLKELTWDILESSYISILKKKHLK